MNDIDKWDKILKFFEIKFDMEKNPDLDSILFLIGIQELGKGKIALKKDEKLHVIHIAVCKLMEPYGYYNYTGRDTDGWPHYESVENLPNLKANEQQILMKKSIIKYFETIDINV